MSNEHRATINEQKFEKKSLSNSNTNVIHQLREKQSETTVTEIWMKKSIEAKQTIVIKSAGDHWVWSEMKPDN